MNKAKPKAKSAAISPKKRIFLMAAAAVIIAAAIALTVILVFDGADEGEPPVLPAFGMEILPTKLDELRAEGKITVYGERTPDDIAGFENTFSNGGAHVNVLSGYFAKKATAEATVFELESEEQASSLHSYFYSGQNLSADGKAELRGKHVIFGDSALVDVILSKFA